MVSGGGSSGRSLKALSGTAENTGTVTEYLASGSETRMYQVIGGIRDELQLVNQDLKDLHHQEYEKRLQELSAVKSRSSVKTLLAELAEQRGMAWVDIARMVNVSVSAVRKWRTGGDASPESRVLLARLASFLDLLGEYLIEDPAQWMEMALPLPAGHTVRPVDLYLAGYPTALLDYAAQRSNAERIMDDIEPNWRNKTSSFEVFDDEDGQKSIRFRQG
jgi:transcriptional regulator with XRE-family HTH domain